MKKSKTQSQLLKVAIKKGFENTLHIENAKLVCRDIKRQFNCYLATPSQHPNQVKILREHIKKIYTENGYIGFNDYVDEYHDPYSYFFYVKDKNNTILSTMRLVEKTENNLLPIEMGIISEEQNRRYAINEFKNTIDVNSFTVTNVRSTNILFAGAGLFSIQKNFKTAYFLHDEDSPSIKRLYEKAGGKYTKELNSTIFFPGYTKVKNGIPKPAKWKIMKLNKEGIENLSKKSLAYECLL